MADDPKLVCYAYVDSTHEYMGITQGDFDPLVPGNILYPRNTTPIAPPKYENGKTIPVFNDKNSTWSVQFDYRGQLWYDQNGNPVVITRAGDPMTFVPPLTQQPPAAPEPPVDNYALRTSKVAFFRRTTEAEAAQFMADLTDASPRLKAIFDSVSYLVPGTDEYPQLRAAVEARVGKERADELLAPSND